MGSFAYTCTVSGLPIEVGDKVRFLMLTKNPYSEHRPSCHISDLWFPRTFPLKAIYNDYGSVDDVEEGPFREVWLDGFKIDLLEQGWGDNSCHDVPTKKTMSFEELLNALSEGRVRVERKDRESLGPVEVRLEAPVPGLPTIEAIERAIKSLKLPMYKGTRAHAGALVDSPEHGSIRVRWEEFETEKQIAILQKIEAVLKDKFACMVSASSYPTRDGGAELLIRANPGTENGQIGHEVSDDPLPVVQAMIREDVWQALLKLAGRKTRADYRQRLAKWFIPKRIKWSPVSPDLFGADLFFTSIPRTVGLSTHVELMLNRSVQPIDDTDFIYEVADFISIEQTLSACRFQWHPGSSTGPQFGEYKLHAQLHDEFARIARKRRRSR